RPAEGAQGLAEFDDQVIARVHQRLEFLAGDVAALEQLVRLCLQHRVRAGVGGSPERVPGQRRGQVVGELHGVLERRAEEYFLYLLREALWSRVDADGARGGG